MGRNYYCLRQAVALVGRSANWKLASSKYWDTEYSIRGRGITVFSKYRRLAFLPKFLNMHNIGVTCDHTELSSGKKMH